MKPLPLIAIIGRPNVGKSTLFNRLLGKRVAIVEDQPGVTRDRNYARCRYTDKEFFIVDTGGLIIEGDEGILAKIRRQTEEAIDEADQIIFLLDGKEGVTHDDREIVEVLRKVKKPIFYSVNKIDGPKAKDRIYEFYQLGIDPIYPVSAEHGYGIDDLMEEICSLLPRSKYTEEVEEKLPKITVLGRPNVGKSTLINTLLDKERLVTSELPGTTRDPIDTIVISRGKSYLFIDTAGIRRRGRIERGVERYSVSRAANTLSRADIALLLIDAAEGVVEQDTKIAGIVLKEGRGLILLINKWDMVSSNPMMRKKFEAEISRRFPFLANTPHLFISAKKHRDLDKIFPIIDQVMEGCTLMVSTSALNRLLEEVISTNPPPSYKGMRVRIKYITQIGSSPPTFLIFSNRPEGIKRGYIRFLEGKIIERFQIVGSPVRVKIRGRERA